MATNENDKNKEIRHERFMETAETAGRVVKRNKTKLDEEKDKKDETPSA